MTLISNAVREAGLGGEWSRSTSAPLTTGDVQVHAWGAGDESEAHFAGGRDHPPMGFKGAYQEPKNDAALLATDEKPPVRAARALWPFSLGEAASLLVARPQERAFKRFQYALAIKIH